MLRALVNGVAVTAMQPALRVDDRGLLYGDGLFETMRLSNGVVQLLDAHLKRLRLGCERMKIALCDDAVLHAELRQLIGTTPDGVVKLIVTRGHGSRGYRAAPGVPSIVWQLFAPFTGSSHSIVVRWCEVRLSRNTLLAGIKHLNRLEQVMAQSEWTDAAIAEGLMLDTEGELVCGTMSNIFLVVDGVMVTSDLRYCGVRGVMRGQVLQLARAAGIETEERSLHPEELMAAEEVFVTNALRGIQPVGRLVPGTDTSMAREWGEGAITAQLTALLAPQR